MSDESDGTEEPDAAARDASDGPDRAGGRDARRVTGDGAGGPRGRAAGPVGSLVADFAVGWELVRADSVRRLRRVWGNRKLLAAAVLLSLVALPVVLFVSVWLHGVGQQSRTGLDYPAVAAARNLVAPMLVVYTAFSALSAAQQLGEDRARQLLLTTVSSRALLVGEVGIEFLGAGVLFVLPVAIFGSAFAIGAGTPVTVVVLLVTGLPLVVLAFLFGTLLGYAFWLGLYALPISGGARQVGGALASLVLALGSIGIGFVLGGGAAEGGLGAAVPTGPPPTPLGWYADLFFLGSPLATTPGPGTALAAVLVLAAIGLVAMGLTRVAPRFWYAVPNRPESGTGDASGPPQAPGEATGAASATVGRRGRLAGSQMFRLAAGYVRRARRSPDRLTYLFYYLIIAGFIGLPGLFPGSELGPRVTGVALLLLGSWLAGAVFCLNPLGDEGRMLGQLLLAETPARTVVAARFLLGVAVGLPVALAGIAVVLATTPTSAASAVVTVSTVVLLVFASAGSALGIGTAVPRFGTARVFGSVEVVAPATVAAVGHGALAMLLAVGTLNLPALAVDATGLGPAWARWLALGTFGLLLVGSADAGRRYATAGFERYGRQPAPFPTDAGTPLAVYTAVVLALVAFAVAQLVTLATSTLGVLASSSAAVRLVVLFVAQYAGFAAVALGFRYVTRRGLPGLDRSLSLSRDGVALAGGLAGGLALWLAAQAVAGQFGLPSADQALVESALAEPQLLLVLVPLVVLVNAPVEELLYRTVIQGTLAETVGTTPAILLTSLLFALVHLPAYFDPDPVAVGVSLTLLFLLSCLWGAVYEYSGSLRVTAAAHGLYNAVVLGVAYVSAVG